MPSQVGQTGRQTCGKRVHFGRLVAVANQGFDFPQIRVQLPQFGIERVDFVGQDIGVDVERCEAIEC
jgi:hypothetical protein